MTRDNFNVSELQFYSPYVMFLSLIILLFTLLIFWCWSRRKYHRKSVLLTGLSDSGKTLLFCRLLHSQYKQTYTSTKTNSELYLVPGKSLEVVDIPGHERLRGKYFDQYKSAALGIVYIIDSVAFQKEIRDVVEYLYNILTDKAILNNRVSLLILCNKQDQPLAKGNQLIKTLIEKELNVLRKTKSSQLESVDPSQITSSHFLGNPNKDFEFSHLDLSVKFGECSALKGEESEADIKSLESWLSSL